MGTADPSAKPHTQCANAFLSSALQARMTFLPSLLQAPKQIRLAWDFSFSSGCYVRPYVCLYGFVVVFGFPSLFSSLFLLVVVIPPGVSFPLLLGGSADTLGRAPADSCKRQFSSRHLEKERAREERNSE